MSLKSITDKYEIGLRPLIFIATFIAGLALVAMMLVTVYDIFLRFVFHRSMAGAFEITEFTLAIMAPLALIYCEKSVTTFPWIWSCNFFLKKCNW